MYKIGGHSKNIFSFSFIAKVLLMFGFIYPFSLEWVGVPSSLNASRLAVIVIVFIVLIKYSRGKRISVKKNPLYQVYKKVFGLVAFTLVYCLLISLIIGFGRGTNYVIIALDNILFSLLPIGAFYCFFNDIDEFTNAIIGVTLLQSIAIFFSVFVPGLSALFDILSNYEVGYGERDIELFKQSYASGIACFTSEGVTKFTIGLVACVYKYLSQRKPLYLILFLVFSVANSMLSRTGMLMAVIGITIIFYFLIREKKISFTVLLSIITITIVGYYFFNSRTSDFYDRFSRYNELMDGGTQNFIEGYFEGSTTVIPPIGISTIMGTSIISGESGNGVAVVADGGFIKNYAALGLVLSLIVYGYMMIVFLHILRCFKTTFFYYVIIFYMLYVFLSDFKEYFLLFRGTICLFFLYVFFAADIYLTNGKTKSNTLYR